MANQVRCTTTLASLLLCFISGCGQEGHWIPARPENLPDSASYIGGPDAGYWMSCEDTSAQDLVCDVFDQETGSSVRRMYLRICLTGHRSDEFSAARLAMLDGRGVLLDQVWAIRTRPDEIFDTSLDFGSMSEGAFTAYRYDDHCGLDE
jgi:hypothetical protein